MLNAKTKSYLYIILTVTFLILSAIFISMKRKTIEWYLKREKDELVMNETEIVIGVSDRSTLAPFDTVCNFTHFVFKITTEKSFRFKNSDLEKFAKSEKALITFEFMGNKFFNNINNNPFEQIINGLYDKKLEYIIQTILLKNKNIYVRLMPEMEVPVYKFRWQNLSGEQYIESYRYLFMKLKNLNPNLKFVWGPTGFMGAEEYYPGNDVVDFMSITLRNASESLFTGYPAYTDLKDEIHRKFHRLRFFNHPVIILNNQIINNRSTIFNFVNDEIDSIAKYQNVAYNENLWATANTVPEKGKFIIGLHDPKQSLINDPAISAEHIFVDFGQVQSGELNRLLHDVFSRNHDVILTVEPWRDISGTPDSAVMHNILSGKYDSIIQRVFADISETTHTVFLRFAHEMEIPITRYAWQSQDPLIYIRAYRYFMNFVQPVPHNVKRIWGPAGDRSSPDFYPGNDVVDYISFAVYGLPDKNITDHEKQNTFSKIFKHKIWRFRFIDKPVFITEFGVRGPEDYQTRWLEDAAKTLNENPRVIGVNYFNMSDTPGAWGEIKEPDWSITPNSLHRFMEILKRDS
jgi:beta-mannanase